MPIIIDKTNCNDHFYVELFDSTFSQWLFNQLSDVTFSDTTKHIKWGVQSASNFDWVYLPDLAVFNSLSISKDLDIIVSRELLRTYESNYQRILYYTINVDYNPIRCNQYARQLMNVLVNLWEGFDRTDTTTSFVGLKYAFQEYFNLSDPVDCVIWSRPQARNINADKANYLRQSIDFIFMLSINKFFVVCR